MGNPYGRSIIIPLTNQSGGGVIAGDVVVVDTAHDDSFTTDTSGGFVGTVGVAQATIGSGSIGLVALSGKVDLVNVNASVTRGHYGKTYTVAKQATDAGAARGVGTFCEFTTGGTIPKAILWPVDLLGSSLTDPTTTRGDNITRGASALQRLALGSVNQIRRSDGTDDTWGSLVPNRRGGNTTDWSIGGTTNYTPANPTVQAGVTPAATVGTTPSVTFPVAFTNSPLVILTAFPATVGGDQYASLDTVSNTGFSFFMNGHTGGTSQVNWLAIGI